MLSPSFTGTIIMLKSPPFHYRAAKIGINF